MNVVPPDPPLLDAVGQGLINGGVFEQETVVHHVVFAGGEGFDVHEFGYA